MDENDKEPNPDGQPRARPHTTRKFAELHDGTAPALEALRGIVANHAKRHPGDPVPAGIEADAAALLAAARRIMGREPGWRAPLGLRTRPAWSELEAKLALALVGLRRFKARYYLYDETLGAYRWHLGGRAGKPAAATREERNARLVGRALATLERQLAEVERDH